METRSDAVPVSQSPHIVVSEPAQTASRKAAMAPLKEELSKVVSKGEKLNQATEKLNKLIAHVDAELAKAGVGVEVWLGGQLLDVSSETEIREGEFNQTGWDIGYARLPDGWHLAAHHVTRTYPSGETRSLEDPKNLLLAPRVVRLESAEYLEQLFKAIGERADHYIEKAEKAGTSFAK